MIFGNQATVRINRRRWLLPWDRFVEWEPSDEVWAKPLGIGENDSVMLPVKKWNVTHKVSKLEP